MRVLVLGVSAGMLAGVIHGLVDNSYFLVDLSILFWTFCALVSFAASECEIDIAWLPVLPQSWQRPQSSR
jgi:tetrahydromethanopterin S-methyltransferase subunit C